MEIMTESTEEKAPDTQNAADTSGETAAKEREPEMPDGQRENSAEAELSDKEKIEALEKENAELKDQLLRRAADFDNYRKRVIKEKAEAVEYANSNLLADLLESLDNFDRTVDAAATATDAQSIADVSEPVLKEIYLKGYKLKDRIIRHAKVTVTMPASSNE